MFSSSSYNNNINAFDGFFDYPLTSFGYSPHLANFFTKNGKNFEVSIDLPGYEKEEINITLGLKSKTLCISSVLKNEAIKHKSDFYYTIDLPSYIDLNESKIVYRNGVLTIAFNKLTTPEPKEELKQLAIN